MGEIQDRPFQVSFNAFLKAGFQGSRVTSDGRLILVRELDERLGFGELIERHVEHGRAFGLGTNAKKIASGGKGSILVRNQEGKREIRASIE